MSRSEAILVQFKKNLRRNITRQEVTFPMDSVKISFFLYLSFLQSFSFVSGESLSFALFLQPNGSSSPTTEGVLETLRADSVPVTIFTNLNVPKISDHFDGMIFESPSTDSINSLGIISFLINATFYKFDTLIVLIFSKDPESPSDYLPILREFYKRGVYNTAIGSLDSSNSLKFLRHSPFDLNATSLSSTDYNWTNYDDYFDSLKDLNGHQFTVLFYPTNWISLDKQRPQELTGIDSNFVKILMERHNATYKPRALKSYEELWAMDLNLTTNLLVNIFTVNNDTIAEKFDRIFVDKMDTLGLLVTSNRLENAWELMLMYFQYSPAFSAMVLIQTVLLNLILGRRNWELFSYNSVIPWALSQNAAVPKNRRRGAKVFICGVIWFNFIIWLHVLSTYTSKSIAFLADRSITTKEQLTKEGVPIFADKANKDNLEYMDEYKEFMAKVKTYNGSLWEQPTCRYKCAYITDMILMDAIMSSATNLNEFGELKYYKLKDMVMSLPLVNLVPANSPFTRLSKKLLSIINESGLEPHWIRKLLYEDKSVGLRFFKTDVKYDKFVPQGFSEISCVFILLGIGLGLAVISFLVELWLGKPASRDTTRRMHGESR